MNLKVLDLISSSTNLKIDFGGGLKSNEDLQLAFDYGASQVTGGSIAVDSPPVFTSWLNQYGPEKIILGADCKKQMIATHGWTQYSETNVLDFIGQYAKQGIEYVVCTDISKDGMLSGPSFGLYISILKRHNIKLIASGGISSIQDLTQLKSIGCEGSIIGKAIYENKISLSELEKLC